MRIFYHYMLHIHRGKFSTPLHSFLQINQRMGRSYMIKLLRHENLMGLTELS